MDNVRAGSVRVSGRGSGRGSVSFQTINHIAVARREDGLVRITAYPIKDSVNATTLILDQDVVRELILELDRVLP